MAMSVVEHPVAETAPRSPHLQLALSSFLGAVYVLFSLWMVFGGLPYFWGEFLAFENEFLGGALLLIATLFLGLGLWYIGYHLEKTHAQHGLRTGVFVGALFIYLISWLCLSMIGPFLESRDIGVAGAIITTLVGTGLAYGAYRMFTKPGFAAWLQRVEDRGWLHALPYKPTQGVRVRRGTVLAILVLGIFGIITLISHKTLGYERVGFPPNNWEWSIPFTGEDARDDFFIPLMFEVHLVMPLILFVATLWIAWRVVNWPTFADFLIATEAEMNKVSWTTRKRLVQDTIVVLVTVFLLTTFLFVVDILWIKVLSNPWFKVLYVDPQAELQKQQEKTQW
jgi:preprotein translocase SecE subunit